MIQQHMAMNAEHALVTEELSSEIATLKQQKAKLEDRVAELKKSEEDNVQKSKDINRQLQMVLTMYVKMQKDFQTVMSTAGSQNIEEFVQTYRRMVNINSVWDLQNRFQVRR
eukprot:760853-Hanusia_phi.AAC.3